MSDHLIERVEAECAMRHPTLGSVVLSVSDARRLAELARKGLEAERITNAYLAYRACPCRQTWEPVVEALHATVAPKEPPHA